MQTWPLSFAGSVSASEAADRIEFAHGGGREEWKAPGPGEPGMISYTRPNNKRPRRLRALGPLTRVLIVIKAANIHRLSSFIRKVRNTF